MANTSTTRQAAILITGTAFFMAMASCGDNSTPKRQDGGGMGGALGTKDAPNAGSTADTTSSDGSMDIPGLLSTGGITSSGGTVTGGSGGTGGSTTPGIGDASGTEKRDGSAPIDGTATGGAGATSDGPVDVPVASGTGGVTSTGGTGGIAAMDSAMPMDGPKIDGAGETGGLPCPRLYSDKGVPAGTALWTWTGADWGMASGVFDGSSTDCNGAPEGKTCFKTQSGVNPDGGGTNYAGWGVFAGSDSNWDLSACTRLIFCAETDAPLKTIKVEIQTVSKDGAKYAVHPTLTPGLWQPIVITKDQFSGASFASVFGAFLVTDESGSQTFRIDDVRWDNGSGALPADTCQSQGPVGGMDASVD